MIFLQGPSVAPKIAPLPILRDLRAAIPAAQKARRPILVSIGASWCAPCHALEKELAGEPYRGILMRNYVTCFVQLDAKDKVVAKRIQALKASAPNPAAPIPYILVLDSRGKILADGNGAFGGEALMRAFHATIPKDKRIAELMPLRKYLDRER